MIEIKKICKNFDSVKALDNLDFSIGDAVVFGLVGPNGSGKSTLLRIISGVFQADSGEVLIDGENVFDNINVKSNCFFISDYPFFSNDSTVENIASLYKKIYPNWSNERYLKLCKTFPIHTKARIINMSKGMQRQAALILALSTCPKYIFLDEIFDGLDPVIRQMVKKLLMEDVASIGTTVIIASHNLRELEDVCDHIGLIDKGGILMEDSLDELKLGMHKIQMAFNSDITKEHFKSFDVISYKVDGRVINITVRGDINEIISYINSLNPLFVQTIPLTLEEVFIQEMEVAGYDGNHLKKQ